MTKDEYLKCQIMKDIFNRLNTVCSDVTLEFQKELNDIGTRISTTLRKKLIDEGLLVQENVLFLAEAEVLRDAKLSLLGGFIS
ncbi:hypothetical protein KKF61_07865 [Patescibacteria group bacterium]|nr:hypothetical protein [Patescibacteria group bacterium]